MDAASVLTIMAAGIKVLKVLIPLAIKIYNAVKDKNEPEFTKENATDKLIEMAKANGKVIGHTEAKIAIEAVHLATAKATRVKALDTTPVVKDKKGAGLGKVKK
ncbi:MAG: hypothetical protein JRI80_00230 [Deltaproteobacteria bacterium]|nr:hypothetical protein [Deltaproteobacteria bacterium]